MTLPERIYSLAADVCVPLAEMKGEPADTGRAWFLKLPDVIRERDKLLKFYRITAQDV